MPRIAIVGAGLAGLVTATKLSGRAELVVFEKSRGPGGRMATRYAGDHAFDHGAQFFTARSRNFRAFLQPLVEAGVVKNWTAKFVELDRGDVRAARPWGDDYPHYVGTPGMNRVGKFLAERLDIRLDTTVARIKRDGRGWALFDSAGEKLGAFDWLVLAAPAAQTAVLAQDHAALVSLCVEHHMSSCFAMMLGFERPLDLPWDAALVRNADISWVSVNSSKPGREGGYSLVIHSTNAWADAHLETDLEEVREHLLEAAARAIGQEFVGVEHCGVHRWRFANIAKQAGPRYFIDRDLRLAACGDWFIRGRIEAAFESGAGLAAAMGDETGKVY
jgi:renalase